MAEATLLVKVENAGTAANGNGNGNGGDSKPKPPPQPSESFGQIIKSLPKSIHKGIKAAPKDLAGAVKGGLKTAGVSFSMAAILKQSQVFTSFVGSLFQILGALVDVTLAPLMPIFIPVLKFLAKMMPGAAAMGKIVADGIMAAINWIRSNKYMQAIGAWWKETMPDWAQMSTDKIAYAAGMVFAAIFLARFTGVWKLVKWVGKITRINALLSSFVKSVGGWMKTLVTKPFGWLRSALGWAAKKIGLDKMWVVVKSWFGSIGKSIATKFKNLIGAIKSGIAKALTSTGKALASLGKGIFNRLKSIAARLLKAPISLLKGFGNVIKKAIGGFWTKLKAIPMKMLKGAAGMLAKLGKATWAFLKGLPAKILSPIKGVLKTVLGKPFEVLGKALAKIPGLGKLAGGITKMFAKGGAGSLLAKVGGKTGMKAAGMSIPGVGALIGAAAGAYETTRMVRKYGVSKKTIGAGLAYTAANVGAGLAGGPAGLAVAIGSEIALQQFESRVLKVEIAGPDDTAKVSMRTKDNKNQATELSFTASDFQPGFPEG